MAPDEDAPNGLPLAGIRVADFSRVLAGPLATMLLADLGADVDQGRAPRRRATTPAAGDRRSSARTPRTSCALNRNKRSIALDLATDEGVGARRRLAALVGRRGGELPAGPDGSASAWTTRRSPAEHPSLVYCSLTAFGDDRRGRRAPGYDIIVQALSGLMSFTGAPGWRAHEGGRRAARRDLRALRGERDPGRAAAARERTGRGGRVSVSLFDASVAALVNQAANYLLGGLVPGPTRQRAPEHRAVPAVRRRRPPVHPRRRQRPAVRANVRGDRQTRARRRRALRAPTRPACATGAR